MVPRGGGHQVSKINSLRKSAFRGIPRVAFPPRVPGEASNAALSAFFYLRAAAWVGGVHVYSRPRLLLAAHERMPWAHCPDACASPRRLGLIRAASSLQRAGLVTGRCGTGPPRRTWLEGPAPQRPMGVLPAKLLGDIARRDHRLFRVECRGLGAANQ